MVTLLNDYPKSFWVLVLASFIDRLGGALLYTFFALYITDRFSVGLTQVGLVVSIFGVMGFVGGFAGGVVADRYGRKNVIIISLVTSATSTLMLGYVGSMMWLYVISFVVGLFSEIGGPAREAMVADMLPGPKQAEGYGILRVGNNLAVVLGPIIGGFLASRSYLSLFYADAITSIIMAGIVMLMIAETYHPAQMNSSSDENDRVNIASYLNILRNHVFLAFIVISLVTNFVYQQMYVTLPVYLRDVRGVPPQGYGYILSMNAFMVVAFQFWITRRISKFPPMLTVAAASVFYGLGYAMYGFANAYVWFMAAMALITLGEMIFFPTGRAFVAALAPANKRGRYMALYSFAAAIPTSVGTLAAGLMMDNLNPNLFWYVCGVLAGITALAYILLQRYVPATPTEEATVQAATPEPLAVGD